MPEFHVVVNDCAAPPHVGLTHVRTRRTDVGERSFQFDYDRMVAGLPRQLTPREQDFADVLGAIFAIDVACHRGEDADWTRNIEAWIPVRDPDLWNSLSSRLGRCFGAFTYDRLAVHFVHDDGAAPAPRQGRQAHPASTGVALLSGGVDSFVGAAVLLEQGAQPLLLSHKNSSAASAALTAIMPSLVERGASTPLSFTARRSGSGEGEGSQRARSMVYMGLASLLATAHEHSDVWINENGVMAVHLPLTEARTGSFSTRTASPRAIRQFAELATDALGSPVMISNLLVEMTKPEVAQAGVTLGLRDVLPSTVSCWSAGRTATHCGRCVPCLIRQISHEWAGVPGNDYDNQPLDELPEDPAAAVARDNVSHLLQLATDLDELPDELIELDYPELLDVAAPLTVDASLAMHRRWGQQCLEVARRHPYSRAQL